MMFNERVSPLIEIPSREQALAMIEDFATTKEFSKLSSRHKIYIAAIQSYIEKSSPTRERIEEAFSG